MINITRYRKLRRFFVGIFWHTLFWDMLMTLPLLRYFRTPPIPRWKKIAGKFRGIATEMGGVLIKLGQFLSIRVDILPLEITSELSGLQDEVQAEKTEDIIARIENDFSAPISEIFDWFSPEPLGAASLAQVHTVTLHSGENAVVKVLRPGIEVLVETDLKAISMAFRWLKFYRRVSTRVDLDWLAEEFTTVTRRELDFISEGKNAERLARDFAHDPQVYIPKIYWDYSQLHILTLENVSYIKIGDLQGIDATGIDRTEVADKLHNIYMQQVFETFFVHVDPHPGNLFVKPLPTPDEIESGIKAFLPGTPVPFTPHRPFQLVLVDFGMTAVIPERLRSAIREYAIAFGTRDAYRMVQSYIRAGTLLEDADLKRLEEAHEAMFNRFWGIEVGRMREVIRKEGAQFIKEFRDVINEAPFQFQADMLFVVRAIGILSGMAANLDPGFDPWVKTIPYAKKFAKEELKKDWAQEATLWIAHLFNLPEQTDRLLKQCLQGKFVVQQSMAPDTRKAVRRLEKSIDRLSWMVCSGCLLIAGIQAQMFSRTAGTILIVMAILSFFWGRRGK